MKTLRFKLVGGMGNQLFILAAALSFLRAGRRVEINLSDSSRVLHSSNQSYNSIIDDWAFRRFDVVDDLSHEDTQELTEGYNFGPGNLRSLTGGGSPILLKGYFQNLSYWDDFDLIAGEVCSIFQSAELPPRLNNRIGCHIRRGDYLTNANANKTIGLYGPKFFKQAKRALGADNFQMEIYSDEINVLEKQNWLKGATFINNPSSPLESFRNLSTYSTYIISNSTFAWWAMVSAYIRSRHIKVVLPSIWVRKNDFGIDLFSGLPSGINIKLTK